MESGCLNCKKNETSLNHHGAFWEATWVCAHPEKVAENISFGDQIQFIEFFSCPECSATWMLEHEEWDRPPFANYALVISREELELLHQLPNEQLAALAEKTSITQWVRANRSKA